METWGFEDGQKRPDSTDVKVVDDGLVDDGEHFNPGTVHVEPGHSCTTATIQLEPSQIYISPLDFVHLSPTTGFPVPMTD